MNRWFGSLTASDVESRLTDDAILCLPIGAYEQHGPHLPLHTDTVIAEKFTELLVQRYWRLHNLWILPSIPYGLSFEHVWSPGTLSLSVELFSALLDLVVEQYVRATPARKLIIVSGHGGNRGILEAVTYELQAKHGLRICVLHPSALATVSLLPFVSEVHAGTKETSMMMALAPEEVHLDRLTQAGFVARECQEDVTRVIKNRGTTWPWSSDDSRISSLGIIGGDPRLASAQLGQSLIESALGECGAILGEL